MYLIACALALKVADAQQPEELKIAAASDLTYAMDKLVPAFEKQSRIHVTVSLGSSGNFFAQIENGAPFDVFLSADRSYPEKLAAVGKADGRLVPYARGRLVLWTLNSSKLRLPSSDAQVLDGNLDVLAGPSVGKIAIANPEHAPYGRAAVAALQHFGIYERVKSKIVLGENISQTAQFAVSGNADVALIALSLAATGSMQSQGRWVLLPEDSYPPIEQAAVALSSSSRKVEAKQFLDFLTSSEGQTILRDYGFGTPSSGASAK